MLLKFVVCLYLVEVFVFSDNFYTNGKEVFRIKNHVIHNPKLIGEIEKHIDHEDPEQYYYNEGEKGYLNFKEMHSNENEIFVSDKSKDIDLDINKEYFSNENQEYDHDCDNDSDGHAVDIDNNIIVVDDENESNDYANDDDKDVTPVCPQDKSIFRKRDIQSMIEDVDASKPIYDLMKQKFIARAIDIRNKHKKSFVEFLDSFKNHPQKLEDLLSNLKQNRPALERKVQKLTLDMKMYDDFEQNYITKGDNIYNKLKAKLNRIELICQDCQSEDVEVFPLMGKYDYLGPDTYCSTYEDLQNIIKEHLSTIYQNFVVQLDINLSEIDSYLQKLIDEFKTDTITNTLSKFGRPMYEVLDYEYNKFRNISIIIVIIITNADPEAHTNNFDKILPSIQISLTELKLLIEQYKRHCIDCEGNSYRPLKLFAVHNQIRHKNDEVSRDSNNILHAALSEKEIEISLKIEEDLIDMFVVLRDEITNTNDTAIYIDNLKPIQEEIINQTREEMVKLNNMKKIVSESAIDQLEEFTQKSKGLLQSIEKKKKDINENQYDNYNEE